MKEIKIQVPDGKKAVWGEDGKLTLVDDKPAEQKEENRLFDKTLPITERVKTFEDALMLTGMTFPIDERTMELLGKDVVAYMKLRVIAAALNELTETTLDEFPKFTEDEYRYYPWLILYTQKEIDEMSDEDKEKIQLWLVGGSSDHGSVCGVGCSYSNYDWSYSGASISARLAVKTPELAKYFGRQFIELWSDYAFKPKQEE